MSKYLDLSGARDVFNRGENVTEFLRRQRGVSENSSEIIEIAYDLQAGEYVRWALANLDRVKLYADEISGILGPHVEDSDVLLDVGTGEITTFSAVLAALPVKPGRALGFDISWSRLLKGCEFAKAHMGPAYDVFTPFAADMKAVPLPDKSVDVTTSSHALEPNGRNLDRLLQELFRVTRKKLVLFEPCYEINSPEGRARMDRLGYIKGMAEAIADRGATLEQMIPMRNIMNPLNPTAAFVITPPAAGDVRGADAMFSVPGSNIALEPLDDGFWYSRATGLCFPVLRGIPILRESAAILASAAGE